MTTDRHHALQGRRPRILAAAAILAVAGALVLAGCGSSGAGSAAGSVGASGSSAGDPGADAASAGSTAIPTQDVVSAIKEDPKLNAELPASMRSSGQLILGTTL